MAHSNHNPSPPPTGTLPLLVVRSSVLAVAVGVLLVLYHLLFILLTVTNLGAMEPADLSYALLMIGINVIYIIGVIVLVRLTSSQPHFYRPKLWVAVLLLIPGLIYLNYFLVSTRTPYNGGF